MQDHICPNAKLEKKTNYYKARGKLLDNGINDIRKQAQFK